MNFLTESACAIWEMFLIKRPFSPRCRFRKCPTMAKTTKKKSSSKRPSASKARPARKAPVKRPVLKKVSRTAKTAKGGPSKSRKETTESPALLLGMNHREKRLDPFVRQQKEKLLQLQRVRWRGLHLVAGGDARDHRGGRHAERSRHGGPLLPVVAGVLCDCCCRRPGSPPPVTFWNRWRNCCCACTSDALGSTRTVSCSVRPLVTSM